jgi:hypothetical protein
VVAVKRIIPKGAVRLTAVQDRIEKRPREAGFLLFREIFQDVGAVCHSKQVKVTGDLIVSFVRNRPANPDLLKPDMAYQKIVKGVGALCYIDLVAKESKRVQAAWRPAGRALDPIDVMERRIPPVLAIDE